MLMRLHLDSRGNDSSHTIDNLALATAMPPFAYAKHPVIAAFNHIHVSHTYFQMRKNVFNLKNVMLNFRWIYRISQKGGIEADESERP
jgi:hypothetical protein